MKRYGYGRMFPGLQAYLPEPDRLDILGTFLSRVGKYPDADPFFPPPADETLLKAMFAPPQIPAGYTYLGQFIIHDISFDERSDRHQHNHLPFWGVMDEASINALRNLREPQFNLETIYGHDEPFNEGETPRRELFRKDSPLPLLRLGKTGGFDPPGAGLLSFPCDLPREETSATAKIVDQRNDENLLLAQTQVAFIKFHNALVAYLARQNGEYTDAAGKYKKTAIFEKARALAIRYYQKIILTDFLPRIVDTQILEWVLEKRRNDPEALIYQPQASAMFIPLEFSVAAFRFAHSMIRSEYNLNFKHLKTESKKPLLLDDMMMFTGRGKMNDNPARKILPSIWIIDWNLFYELNSSNSGNSPFFNIANPIDTELPEALLRLRPIVRSRDGRASSIAAIDLFRGRKFQLPDGQTVARAIGGEAAGSALDIAALIREKEMKNMEPAAAEQIKNALCDSFAERTPLWFYILAEAEREQTGKLGAVGSRIVAETLVQLLYFSDHSILRFPDWNDGDDFLLDEADGSFSMPRMLEFIQKMNADHRDLLYPEMESPFDELNPLGEG